MCGQMVARLLTAISAVAIMNVSVDVCPPLYMIKEIHETLRSVCSTAQRTHSTNSITLGLIHSYIRLVQLEL